MVESYYTFRLISPTLVEVAKWEEGSIRPKDVYKVDPTTSSCNCFATKRDCKHVKRAQEVTDPEFINEVFRWRWDEDEGWTEMTDIPMPQDLIREFDL